VSRFLQSISSLIDRATIYNFQELVAFDVLQNRLGESALQEGCAYFTRHN
jgi:hypothetical protein